MYVDIMQDLTLWLGTKPSFGKAELLVKLGPIISSLTNAPTPKAFTVTSLKKYDVLYLNTIGIMHYILVHKVTEDEVRGIILSSKKDAHNLFQLQEDRFFKNAYATKTYVTYSLEQSMGAFSRVYESKGEANRVFSELKRFHKESFGRK